MLAQSASPNRVLRPLNLDESTEEIALQIDDSPLATTEETSTGDQQMSTRPTRRWRTFALIIGLFLLVLGGIVAAVGWYSYQTALTLKSQGLEARELARGAYDQFKSQNLPGTEQQLVALQAKTAEIRQTYQKLSFYRFVPIAQWYYADGIHGLNAADAGLRSGLKSVQTVAPYADILGFEGEGTFTGGTAEDRLKILLETLDKVTPELDSIAADLQVVDDELGQIKSDRYPETFRGIPVRSSIHQAQELSQGAVTALTEYRPLIEELPALAGGREERKKYLVLFQNDNELRPTGGFLTAYAIIFVEDGKVTLEKSDDIYELDKKFTRKEPIPAALGRYLTTERTWNLRDMNISPDFKVSMDQFYENYQQIRGEPQDIDGIIAIDTHILTDLLKVLGPVEVPGYGVYSAENDPKCDCPQIIYALSEIITRPTPYIREDRKGVLGPLMRAVLTKAYTAPKQQWPDLFTTGLNGIAARHAQFYMFDEQATKALASINANGTMQPPANGEDFLAIIDANLGGAKSNLFTDYSVRQIVGAPEAGRLTKTVEISYKNNRRGDNCNLEAGLLCLNSTLRDWHRLYLPAGAELIEAQGFTQQPSVYEEAGLSVIDGYFILEPNSQAKVKITYTIPYADTENYAVNIWKQGGIGPIQHVIEVNGNEDELVVDTDSTYKSSF